MAYLNAAERKALLDELVGMSFGWAKWKLQHLDPQVRLVFYRNVQNVNEWVTRYELPGLGTKVTLVEAKQDGSDQVQGEKGSNIKESWQKIGYELKRVIVEPTPNNRT